MHSRNPKREDLSEQTFRPLARRLSPALTSSICKIHRSHLAKDKLEALAPWPDFPHTFRPGFPTNRLDDRTAICCSDASNMLSNCSMNSTAVIRKLLSLGFSDQSLSRHFRRYWHAQSRAPAGTIIRLPSPHPDQTCLIHSERN